MQVRAFAEYQTLRLCKFELSRATKHYIYAGLSAREPPNVTSVQVWALANHQTLHLCMFQRSRSTNQKKQYNLEPTWAKTASPQINYTCAGFAHGECSRSAKHYLHLCRFWSSPANGVNQPGDPHANQNRIKLVGHDKHDLITS